jgi:hypothetical protein
MSTEPAKGQQIFGQSRQRGHSPGNSPIVTFPEIGLLAQQFRSLRVNFDLLQL